jgi:hypothetical protein
MKRLRFFYWGNIYFSQNAMADISHNRFFSHEFSEAELACLLKVFIITAMLKKEHTNLKDEGKNKILFVWLTLRNSTMFSPVLHELIKSVGKIQITAIKQMKLR